MELIEEALQYVIDVHAGQVDKSGKPYIYHPLEVMSIVRSKGLPEVYQVVALLHDTIEDDKHYTEGYFVRLFGKAIHESVLRLTHKDSKPYLEYIMTLVNSGDDVAIQVKIADISHNLGRVGGLTDEKTKERLTKKYTEALRILEDAIVVYRLT